MVTCPGFTLPEECFGQALQYILVNIQSILDRQNKERQNFMKQKTKRFAKDIQIHFGMYLNLLCMTME